MNAAFAAVGRRLALLNAAVVVAVIAAVGLAILLLLRQSLDREADQVLAERAEAARDAWEELFRAESAPPTAGAAARRAREDGRGDDGDDGDDDAHEVVESGDIILFAIGRDGRLLADPRGVALPGLPDEAAVRAALGGAIDTRSIRIADEPIRLFTMPVRHDDETLGVVQAARSDREHQAEIRLVAMMSFVGIALGGIVAVPAGMFLARRAMRPIGAAFDRQRAFVADASHELRTPLTLIRATTEMVQRTPDVPPAVRDDLGTVIEEIDATSRLVDDLLLLARLDSEEAPMRRLPVDIGRVVQSAAAPFVPIAEAAGLSLTVGVPTALIVEADADRVRQVVRILLDNAIAYTKPGGTVAVRVERAGTRARVAVRDTGVGIEPADQRRVFDRFYRADRARSRTTGGAGLGLAIARALVLAHHGEIGLDSRPGEGTTVWFALPLAAGS